MACVKRRRIRQIAIAREDIEATAETLIQADLLSIAIFDPTVSYDVPQFERKPAQNTLSNLESISGSKLATLTFQTDVKGGGALNTAPGMSLLAEAAGFIKLPRSVITIGAVTTGPFQLGELVTGGTSSAIGRVLRDINATGDIEIAVHEGTFANAEVLTGSTSGATATTSSTISAAGFAYMPKSTTATQITIGAVTSGPYVSGEYIKGTTSSAVGLVNVDTETGKTILYFDVVSGVFQTGETITGQNSGATSTSSSIPSCAIATPSYTVWSLEDGIIKKIKGCRAKVNFEFGSVGEPARANWEIMGSPVSDPIDGAMFVNSADTITPPKFLSAIITLAAFTPRINSFTLDIDNTLSPRADATDSSGFLGVLITDRNIKGSIDPEMTSIASFDWHGDWFADTLNAFQCKVGATPGNIIDFYANKVQVSGISDDDRDGTAVAGAEFTFVNDNLGDDEIVIAFL